jgi:hypothetical protein
MPRSANEVKLQPAPVYVSLSSIVAVIAVLRAQGTPYPIDEVALQHVSLSMRRQVLSGLRFLRLIDARGRAQPALKALIKAYETSAWPTVLTGVLKAAYDPLFRHDLCAMTPTVFQRVFRSLYPSTDAVTRKAVTFFISAARMAEIPLNQDLFEGRRVRRAGGRHQAPEPLDSMGLKEAPEPRIEASDPGESDPVESPGKSMAAPDGRTALAFLTDLLDEARMTGAEQDAVWILVKYVRRYRNPQHQAA